MDYEYKYIYTKTLKILLDDIKENEFNLFGNGYYDELMITDFLRCDFIENRKSYFKDLNLGNRYIGTDYNISDCNKIESFINECYDLITPNIQKIIISINSKYQNDKYPSDIKHYIYAEFKIKNDERLKEGIDNFINSLKEFVLLKNSFDPLKNEKEIIKFMNHYQLDEKYKMNVLRKYFDGQQLSEVQFYVLNNLIRVSESDLDYDDLTQIKYEDEQQLRETLTNLHFGELIYKLINQEKFKNIKKRMKNGRIANIDKPVIIENLRDDLDLERESFIINEKYFLILNKGIDSNIFKYYLKFNTNITGNEILKVKEKKKKK